MNFFHEVVRSILAYFHITDSSGNPEISETREISIQAGCEMEKPATTPQAEERFADHCPYCSSKDFVKRGTRKKKFEVVQLYLCRACEKTFTAQFVKGKRYPLHIIIEALNYYNLGYSLTQTSSIIRGKFGWEISPSSLSDWVAEFKGVCPYARLRPFVAARFSPKDAVEVTAMAHRQIYKFYYHRAKLALILEDFKHHRFTRLRDYLESVSAETPHHYFQKGDRISELKDKFNYKDVYLRDKQNYATRIAQFVLQAVKENKRRHESLQRFMIANDSVTVATEVPVYLTEEDIMHMQNALHFEIAGFDAWKKNGRILVTGHIDMLQVRNGQVHILDFKPHADKEHPIEQLTWYALALSRLTGIRLYEFVCGWFDDAHYYEFYPLHIVYKKKRKTAKKWDGRLKVGAAREVTALGKSRALNNI